MSWAISRSLEKSALFLPYKKRPNLSRFTFHALDMNRDMPAILTLLDELKPAYIVNFAAQRRGGAELGASRTVVRNQRRGDRRAEQSLEG